jgi:hypothetical protein
MRQYLLVCLSVAMSTTGLVRLNAQCPADLVHAGKLYGEGGPANYVGHPEVVFTLPSGTVIDRSFHQANISAVANNQSDAHSNLTPTKIPGGICIVPSGTNDNNKGWSVGNNDTPTLRASDWDDAGRVSSYVYSMGLYCTVDSGLRGMGSGGCNVAVDVYYKPKQIAKTSAKVRSKQTSGT